MTTEKQVLDALGRIPIDQIEVNNTSSEIAIAQKMLQDMLDYFDEGPTSVTDWEYDFVNSVVEFMEKSGNITKKQFITLSRIHTKYCR